MPRFDEETARQKVKTAQDAWNTRDPEKASLPYTEDSRWRKRDEFFGGRDLALHLTPEVLGPEHRRGSGRVFGRHVFLIVLAGS